MKVEYLNRVDRQYDGMYYPCEKVIRVAKTSTILKVLTVFHELTHWVIDKVTDNSGIYDRFSDVIDEVQDKLPW